MRPLFHRTVPMATSSRPSSTPSTWPPPNAAAVVTGGAFGIGLEITRALATAGVAVLAVGRDAARGAREAAVVTSETGTPVEFVAADLGDVGSLAAVSDAVDARYAGRVHILVNNASIAFKGDTWGAEEADTTLRVNWRGTRALTETLLPRLAAPARIVTVASRSGVAARRGMSAELAARFDGAASAADVEGLAREFVTSVADNSYAAAGWPKSMYGVSKLCQIAWTRALNDELKKDGRDIIATCCCPGSVSTAMSSFRGAKTPAEGADTPVWLALEAEGGMIGGKMWAERKEVEF